MVQHLTKSTRYCDIIADPCFKLGYADLWAGREWTAQRSWDDQEQEAYERGRHFAAWLIEQGEEQIPLTKGYLANPRAETKLMLAFHEGALRP